MTGIWRVNKTESKTAHASTTKVAAEELSKMNARQLSSLLESHGVDSSACIDRNDLLLLARQAFTTHATK
jgi:hypothetical protein